MFHLKKAVAAALVLGVAVSPAAPAAATAPDGLILRRQLQAHDGVAPVPPGSAFTPRSGTGTGLISLERKDPAAPEPQRPPGAQAKGAQGEGGGYGCDTVIDWDFSGVGEDDYLEETVDVLYYGDVKCNFYLYSIEGIAGVWDRSDAFNGENFDGDVISVGSYVYTEWDYAAYSVGGFGVGARLYNGARKVEPGVEWYLEAPEGYIWRSCDPIPGLRYFICDGLGTSFLHVLIGAFGQSTGLTKACRDQRAPVDAEQARVTRLSGAAPASTQIVRQVPAVKDRLTSFKRDLCSVTAGGAGSFAAQRGLDLWETAVAQAKANAAGGDDRPLYWARLAMTAALEQWRPNFGADRAALQVGLDRAARGMTSHAFGAGSGKKVFVSGFDPFDLDGAIVRGNPSGASVLRLDGATVAGAQVQAVIFPVRYAEFNAGLVEEVFRPHLEPGAQQASLITTVSQSRTQFELEFYNGRRRSSTFPDNRNVQGGGSPDNPSVPPSMDAGEEFSQTTLPVDVMRVGSAYPVAIDTSVLEQIPPGTPNRARDDGPTLFSRAVQGSGGGYLSNEIAYRVTRLRDQLRVSVPAGHVHTPAVDPPGGSASAIAAQYRTILEAAIAAPPIPPIALSADRDTYRVGDSPVYSVIGPPGTQILWTGLKNGALTPEVDAFRGQVTDGGGRFTGAYHRWDQGQDGQWTKYVRVGGRLAKVSMTVQPGPSSPAGYVTADFDGDHDSDVSVWRPSEGTWYVNGIGQLPFGTGGDRPVDGDFDGDGRADHAVFRPSENTWYLQQSRDGFRAVQFGAAGDVVVPGDYDGNGVTDIAVWRPSDGTWYLNGIGQLPFGASGDNPVPADYDGDGTTDVAVVRAGLWIIRYSGNGQTAYAPFGFADDVALPADYDGDRRADLAVYRRSEGTWYVLQSGSGAVRTEQWGLPADVPAAGDYDRDGRADLVVWRPSDGVWYQRLSTGTTAYLHFGQSGDVPIPGVNSAY